MFAIVEIAGKQFRVEKDMLLKVPYLKSEVGTAVKFEKVLILGEGTDVKVGKPLVDGASVSAKVVDNGRDKKILVFKKKRRKGYRKLNGHRQDFSKIQIEKIAAK